MGESDVILEAHHISCSREKDQYILRNADLVVREGDIIVLRGKSGSGKTTLLKILAHLNVYEGEILFHGKTPKSYGIPSYRTRVLYVPQRPSLLPGSPKDFVEHVSSFSACRESLKNMKPNILTNMNVQRAMDVANEWGIDEDLWDRNWADLSGGEAQRIALAAAIGLNMAEVLLLDEPTSALDSGSSSLVERYLTNMVKSEDSNSPTKALIWITHSAEQRKNVGTRFIDIISKSLQESDGPGDEVV